MMLAWKKTDGLTFLLCFLVIAPPAVQGIFEEDLLHWDIQLYVNDSRTGNTDVLSLAVGETTRVECIFAVNEARFVPHDFYSIPKNGLICDGRFEQPPICSFDGFDSSLHCCASLKPSRAEVGYKHSECCCFVESVNIHMSRCRQINVSLSDDDHKGSGITIISATSTGVVTTTTPTTTTTTTAAATTTTPTQTTTTTPSQTTTATTTPPPTTKRTTTTAATTTTTTTTAATTTTTPTTTIPPPPPTTTRTTTTANTTITKHAYHYANSNNNSSTNDDGNDDDDNTSNNNKTNQQFPSEVHDPYQDMEVLATISYVLIAVGILAAVTVFVVVMVRRRTGNASNETDNKHMNSVIYSSRQAGVCIGSREDLVDHLDTFWSGDEPFDLDLDPITDNNQPI